jgi:hypothetical protein
MHHGGAVLSKGLFTVPDVLEYGQDFGEQGNFGEDFPYWMAAGLNDDERFVMLYEDPRTL